MRCIETKYSLALRPSALKFNLNMRCIETEVEIGNGWCNGYI